MNTTQFKYVLKSNDKKIYTYLLSTKNTLNNDLPDEVKVIDTSGNLIKNIQSKALPKLILNSSSNVIPIYNYSIKYENIGFGFEDERFNQNGKQVSNRHNQNGYLFHFNNSMNNMEITIFENGQKSIKFRFCEFEKSICNNLL